MKHYPGLALGIHPRDFLISASLFIISSADFTLTNPRITSFYPHSGTFKDTVIIEGENLQYPTSIPSVFFGSFRSDDRTDGFCYRHKPPFRAFFQAFSQDQI